MSEIIISEASKRNMRFMIVLPMLVIPFITVGFGLLGGGNIKASAGLKVNGLNTRLPDAQIAKDSSKDKLTFYQQADADSMKKNEQLRRDPYLNQAINATTTASKVADDEPLKQKIENIRQRLAKTSTDAAPVYEYQEATPKTVEKSFKENHRPDPEMEAINQTLDKLMALQHPAARPERKQNVSTEVLNIKTGEPDDETFFGRRDTTAKTKTFFNGTSTDVNRSVSFTAVIPTSQILQTGSVIKLQITQSISINGHLLAAGNFLFGTASIEDERLMVSIPSVRIDNEVLPVSLSVFDMDGLEGIYVPGSLSRDIAKSSADNALQSINVLSLDPSIKTQAAMAGIGAAKNLLSRKAKQTRVTIGSGYKVLLKVKRLE